MLWCVSRFMCICGWESIRHGDRRDCGSNKLGSEKMNGGIELMHICAAVEGLETAGVICRGAEVLAAVAGRWAVGRGGGRVNNSWSRKHGRGG